MKFHRPGAIMSNARNEILIVERDSIYITEPDGRYIQTIGHRSIKQLYGFKNSFYFLLLNRIFSSRYCFIS